MAHALRGFGAMKTYIENQRLNASNSTLNYLVLTVMTMGITLQSNKRDM